MLSSLKTLSLSAAIERGLPHARPAAQRPPLPRGALAALLCLSAPLVQANTFTVTSTGDPGPAGLSLRNAIAMANAAPGSTVQFDASLIGSTITLSSPHIVISETMSILGPGANKLTVTTGDSTRIFWVDGSSSTQVTIDGLTLKSGTNGAIGSVLYDIDTSLTLRNSVISSSAGGFATLKLATSFYSPNVQLENVYIGNSKTTPDNWMVFLSSNQGVALTATMHKCTISNNAAGAIYLGGAPVNLSIDNSLISSNATTYGGAIYGNAAGNLAVSSSTIAGNSSTRSGGAIFLNNMPATIQDSVIKNNSAGTDGGALYLYDAQVTISNSTISGNSASGNGGGVSVAGSAVPVGTLYLKRSSVTGNHAYDFGAGVDVKRAKNVYVYYTLVNGNTLDDFTTGANGGGLALRLATTRANILDSTFYGNFAYNSGGGIGIFDAGTGNKTIISASTIVHNGTFNGYSNGIVGAGQPTISSSIVANNSNQYTQTQDLVGSFKVNYSLIKNPTAATITGAHNIPSGTDPQLGPLAVNGGPTLSMLPAAVSPVLDQGPSLFLSTVDQRGVSRWVGTRPDMGAVERQNPEVIIFRAGFDSS